MNTQDIGKLLLRVMLGGLLLFHGIDKLTHGISYIVGLIDIYKLPKEIAYGVYIGEIVAPILLILGWKSRWWAAIITINISFAIYLVHTKHFLSLGQQGAWSMEVPIFYLFSSLAIATLGSGKYAIKPD